MTVNINNVNIHADAGLVAGSAERRPPPALWNDVYLLMLTPVCKTQLFRGASYKAHAYTVLLFKEMIINNT